MTRGGLGNGNRSTMKNNDEIHIFNKKKYKERRVELRNNMTKPEKQLWQILRNEQLGVKFRRQHGIGHYIADFYCPELKLVIEVDGDSHYSDEAKIYDKIRDDFMVSLNIVTIRISNNEILNNIDGVYLYIKQQINVRIEEGN